MTTSREAMCKARINYANSTTDNAPYDWFEAGWQAGQAALLAEIKAGGAVCYKYESTTYPDRFYQLSELKPEYFSTDNWTAIPLFRLPEGEQHE